MHTNNLTFSKRNYTLDFIKLLSAYMVVFIHIVFYGTLGTAMDTLARFAVPVFFMSAGFYSYNNSLSKLKHKIKNGFLLFITASVIHHLYYIICTLIADGLPTVVQFYKDLFTIKKSLNFIVWGETLPYSHLWFLIALVYVYIILYLLVKFHVKEQFYYTLAVLCLAVHLLFGEFLPLFNISVPTLHLRNFLFMGYPFFALGMYLNKKKQEATAPSTFVYVLLLFAGAALSLLSRKIGQPAETYLGSVCMSIACFAIALKHPTPKFLAKFDGMSNLYKYIYLLHVLVGDCIIRLAVYTNMNIASRTFGYLYPILVCFATTLLALFLQKKYKK